jgi:gluconate 5-dehydrogenase
MEASEKKTILIAALGSGIGEEITKNLLEDNFRIIGIGGEASKKYSDDLKEQGYSIDFISCDYYSEISIINAIKEARNITKKISGIVNFVGGSLFSKSIQDISLDDFQKVITLNLNSAFVIARESYIWMMEEDGGNIVFFGSTTGFKPSNKKLPYGVAKAGVHAMTWSFALEGSKYNIITNSISPGYVMTKRHIKEIEEKAKSKNKSFEDIVEEYNSKNPLKQSLHPEQLYPTVKLLLTTKSIQGQIIRIDSGQIMG